MKKCIICFVLVLISSCTHRPDASKKTTLSISLDSLPVQVPEELLLSENETVTPLFGTLLKQVSTSASSFNPSQGANIIVGYYLAKSARVTGHVFDSDQELIKTFVYDKVEQGEQAIVWDGKDASGRIVPDEAYFFTLTAEDGSGNKEIYDPTTFSGGEEHDITAADIDQQSKIITYKMPEMGRVMIRIGIQGGALLNTLVDWEPRVKGVITEYWNGKDKDNIINLYNDPKFKMIVTYFSLPDNSVITFGNKEEKYRDYKKSLTRKLYKKPERGSSVSKVSPHYRIPRTVDYSPAINMTFSNTKGMDTNGTILLKDKTIVKVELDEQDKLFFANQQYEIVFFLDNEFYAEDESGYTPFNWVWDLSNGSEGEHILTVNLSSLKDQIGIISQKIEIVK